MSRIAFYGSTAKITLAELRTYVEVNNIHVDGDRRRKQSYLDAIEAWVYESGLNEPYDNDDPEEDDCDGDSQVEVVDDPVIDPEVAEQEEKTTCSFAALLMLLLQVIVIAIAVPVVIVGGILRAIAWGVERIADYAANPRHDGVWNRVQCWVIAI